MTVISRDHVIDNWLVDVTALDETVLRPQDLIEERLVDITGLDEKVLTPQDNPRLLDVSVGRKGAHKTWLKTDWLLLGH